MIAIAKKLSTGIPFVRIDLYEVNGNVYFGEYTFYPAAGYALTEPRDWDYKLGSYLTLPQVTS
jgi:hypothetical protein